jgi:NAD(P)H-hydrate epimerase
MTDFNSEDLKKLFVPNSGSHKGDNGKVMIIAGSKLFHAASLWPLEIASKIVDMVFYASVPENNKLVLDVKKEWRSGIVVPRANIAAYMQEADAVLIGPGLPRESGVEQGDDDTKRLTEDLLQKYPDKRWVIDGGSLQVMNPSLIPHHAILTPHHKEFETLFGIPGTPESCLEMAKKYHCVILLKGDKDIVCSEDSCVTVAGGNAGMTKGGTGDVLAGLVVSLYAKTNDPFLVAQCASYLNKKAGESLFEKVGYYYNASDLVDEIPLTMAKLLL